MQYLPYIAGVIAVIVIVQEFAYLGETSLAWVITGLAVAVLLNAIYLVKGK